MPILPSTYLPSHDENRMASEGDVKLARTTFLEKRPSNLVFLLESRFSWMNSYLRDAKQVYELGSGHGLLKEFCQNPNLRLTDVTSNEWIDLTVDALHTPFEDGSVDAIVASHMIHHLARPLIFFDEMARVIKPNGLLIISEINTSFLMKCMLRLMRHEGWSYEVDVFDRTAVANDPRDPWSANCAIPELLFSDIQHFQKLVPEFCVIHHELCEGFILPLSGGVVAKVNTINFPTWILQCVAGLDKMLIEMMPNIFAFGRRIVLQRTDVITKNDQ